MYSLAIVLVTLAAIYAYRIMKYVEEKNVSNEQNKTEKFITKQWLIFAFASLACTYVHYYGLMAAGIINIILLVYLIKKKEKSLIIKILISGIVQAILYIPWIMILLNQMKNVSKGFWIGFEFPKTLIELLSSQFIGNIKSMVGFILSIILYIYLIFMVNKVRKNKDKIMPGIISILIYFAVVIAAIGITFILKTSILYYRYLFVITGLYIFFISYFLSKEKRTYIIYGICVITLILSIWSNVNQIKEAYSSSNSEPITYLKENVQENDVFVFDEQNFGTGSVVSVNFLNHEQYYYNPSNWGVEEAYKAFGNQLHIYVNEDFLEECEGRIWIIDNGNSELYNKLFNNENYRIVTQKLISTKYEGYVYNFILVESL